MSIKSIRQLVDGEEKPNWETWDRIKHTEWFVCLAATTFAAFWAYIFARAPLFAFLGGYQALAKTMLIWAIFAISFSLLLGQTGLLSFGHAMFWGGSGYAAALVSIHIHGDPILMLVVGTLFALALALVTGFIALRLHTVYFAIMTLALAQLLYHLVSVPLRPITRGRNGLTGVQVEPLFGVVHLAERPPGIFETLWINYEYVLIATIFVLVVVFVNRIRKSPYGLLFKAIRENESRASFVGLDVWRYKFAAYLISGGLAGLAGSLMTIESQFAGLSSLYWLTSGEVVIMAVIGGVGSLFGPVLGAILFLYFEGVVDGFAVIGQYWLLLLALAFTAIVWKFPDGLWGLFERIGAAVRTTLEGKS